VPVIRLAGREAPVPASPAISILVSLQREGVRIESLCGGRAMCGRCAVRIVAGGDLLSVPRQRELDRLREIGATDGVRLACQTFPRGDVRIEIVNPGSTS